MVEAMTSPDASARGFVLDQYADTAPASLPLRAQAALAQMALTASLAAATPDLHLLYGQRAQDLITHLRTAAPQWAATLVLSTQLELQQHGPATARALHDYAASYRAAPFLWREARWRIAFGSLFWQSLDTATRDHMLDEAVWITRFDGGLRPEVEALLGDSAAGVRYQLRMAQVPPTDEAEAEG